jgi:hypothetical protein
MNLHETLQKKEKISHNLYYMWRCVIALSHLDGKVSEEEKKYILLTISKLQERFDMSVEQIETLQQDIIKDQSIQELFKHINDPAYRSNVLHFCRILAHKDGNFCPTEQDILSKMHFEVTEGLDFEKIRSEVQENVAHSIALHDAAINLSKTSGLEFRLLRLRGAIKMLYSIALFFGIDIGEEDFIKKANKKELDQYTKLHQECVNLETEILTKLGFKEIRKPYVGENLIEFYDGNYHYKDYFNHSTIINLDDSEIKRLEDLKEKRLKAFEAVIPKTDTLYSW